MCGECKVGIVCNFRFGLCLDGCEDNWMLFNCIGLLIFKLLILIYMIIKINVF